MATSILQDEPPPGPPDAPRFRPFASTKHTVTKGRYITSSDPRGYMSVFEYPLNGHWLMVDAENGYVLWTGIWKALGNSKTDIIKIIEAQPELAPQLRRVRGGYLKIQGTWMPYETALRLARRVAWPIREDLVPLFGPTFPSTCLSPEQPGYGQLVGNSGKRRIRRTISMSHSSGTPGLLHPTEEEAHPQASTSAMPPPSDLMRPQRHGGMSTSQNQGGAYNITPPAGQQRIPLHIQTQLQPPSPPQPHLHGLSHSPTYGHSPTRARQASGNTTQRYSPYPGTNERERDRHSPVTHPHSYPGASGLSALPAVSPSSPVGSSSLFPDAYTQQGSSSFSEHTSQSHPPPPRPNAILLPPLSSLPPPPPLPYPPWSLNPNINANSLLLTTSPSAFSSTNNYFSNVNPPTSTSYPTPNTASPFSLPPISSLDAPRQEDGSNAVLRRLRMDDEEDERVRRERRERDGRNQGRDEMPTEIYPEPYGRLTMPNEDLRRRRSLSIPPYRGGEIEERTAFHRSYVPPHAHSSQGEERSPAPTASHPSRSHRNLPSPDSSRAAHGRYHSPAMPLDSERDDHMSSRW